MAYPEQHYINVCKHGTIISQCRCPATGKDKAMVQVPCPDACYDEPPCYEGTDHPIPNSWFTKMVVDEIYGGHDSPEMLAFAIEAKLKEQINDYIFGHMS